MDENMLDTFVFSNLKHMGKANFLSYYKGTHASDELHKLHIKNFKKPLCFAFILNTLERKNSNTLGHWLCIFVRLKPETKTLNIKFLDSFKNPYHTYGNNISEYIDRLRIRASNNRFAFKIENVPHMLQAYGSKVCGAYCCYGILKLKNCKENTLKNIFSKFDRKNRKKNDFLIGEFVLRNWPLKSCTDMLTNPRGVAFCPKKVYNHPNCLPKCKCEHKSCEKPKSLEYIRQTLTNLFI